MEKKAKIDFDKTFKNYSSKEGISFREEYLNKFLEKGFPNRQMENWKFLDLQQIINKNIGELNFYNDFNKENDLKKIEFIKEFEHNKIIFINGKLEEIDFKFEEKDKVQVTRELKKSKNKIDNEALLSLNNAFNNIFYNITVKSNYELKKPLIVYHNTNDELKYSNINLQLNFLLEKNSFLKIIDLFNDTSEKNFVNIFYNFDLKQDAILKNFKLDSSSNKNVKYSFNNINQESNSVSETFILSCGSEFIKNEINCNLNGNFSSAFVNGIFYLEKQKQHEIRTKINHMTENTKSYQLIKSVLDDESKSVYQGKIYVDSNAQKTDGYQLSKAILLNENTEFNAKPELEIYADDVKCSHGSASGNLDENSIFYLRSRGLNYKEARSLLINGFLLEVIEKITDTQIKNFIKNILGLK